MPKLKSHKGLLKRIKISGKGKVKFRKSRNGHLRSNKTGDQVRSYRKKGVAKRGDITRLEKMLHRPLLPAE
ncbi:MAG: 50S ribosomal protein L35 [Phycisphaera sp.]|nr:50S ribosomal protein L35 [Phycisphaera sp.]